MSAWGRSTFGEPCRGCDCSWNIETADAQAFVAHLPARSIGLLDNATGQERHPALSWTATGYVAHIGDNLRIWAARIAGASRGGTTVIASYDENALARARGYHGISLPGALWTLERSARDWPDAVTGAPPGLILEHPERGALRLDDIIRTNAHDAMHHVWDIERTLARRPRLLTDPTIGDPANAGPVDPSGFEALGLGLSRGSMRLEPARPVWMGAAEQLISALAGALGGSAAALQHVGSTAVPGLLAKPILDIAVRLSADATDDSVIRVLELAGWGFRGDAGPAGGLVFVLETRPDHRVAHLHVVRHDDVQWHHYLAVRDRLRVDPAARAKYESVKHQLASQHPTDRAAYTNGKDDVVQWLRRAP